MIGDAERLLTKRAASQLTKFIEQLIDVAAQGNAGFPDYIADDVTRMVVAGLRKRHGGAR